MAGAALPPLIPSDGHLEVRPERWTSRMPAAYRDKAPRTVKMPDGGDALLVPGQEPRPVPFLDLRAGRTNETWQPFGVPVEDTAGGGPPAAALEGGGAGGGGAGGGAMEGEGRGWPRGGGAVPKHAGGAPPLAHDGRRRRLSRRRARVQRLARRGVLSCLARSPHRPRRDPVDQP